MSPKDSAKECDLWRRSLKRKPNGNPWFFYTWVLYNIADIKYLLTSLLFIVYFTTLVYKDT